MHADSSHLLKTLLLIPEAGHTCVWKTNHWYHSGHHKHTLANMLGRQGFYVQCCSNVPVHPTSSQVWREFCLLYFHSLSVNTLCQPLQSLANWHNNMGKYTGANNKGHINKSTLLKNHNVYVCSLHKHNLRLWRNSRSLLTCSCITEMQSFTSPLERGSLQASRFSDWRRLVYSWYINCNRPSPISTSPFHLRSTDSSKLSITSHPSAFIHHFADGNIRCASSRAFTYT